MQMRKVGRSGLTVSAVGVGCNNFNVRIDLAATRAVVHKALDLGITLFDTADIYGDWGGSEMMLGEVLGDRRKDVVLATKFSSVKPVAGRPRDASRRHIMTAVEASLRRLKTDWIDLYQQHWPDPLTPTEETLRALDDLVRQGKVRYIGSSNFAGWQIAHAEGTARQIGSGRFVSAQNQYSLLRRAAEHDAIPAMEACGVGLLPYFPLAAGLLTGRHRRDAFAEGTRLAAPRPFEAGFREHADWTLLEKIEAFARERNRTMLELAFGWLLAKPVMASVIAGATKPEQLELNVKAVERPLSPEEVAELDRMTAAHA